MTKGGSLRLRSAQKCKLAKHKMELRSIEAVVGALNGAGVRYLIVGGLAVNAHGYLRATRDLDLVIQLEATNIRRGLESLFEIGYRLAIPVSAEDFADAAKRESWRAEKEMIVLKLWSDDHRRTPIDIFVYEPFNFDAEFENSSLHEVGHGKSARIVPRETLIQMKAEAGRGQDLVDIEELRRVQRMQNEQA
jgi:predicted nucleotidyltransferase